MTNTQTKQIRMLAGALERLNDAYLDGKITKEQHARGEKNLRSSMAAVKAGATVIQSVSVR